MKYTLLHWKMNFWRTATLVYLRENKAQKASLLRTSMKFRSPSLRGLGAIRSSLLSLWLCLRIPSVNSRLLKLLPSWQRKLKNKGPLLNRRTKSISLSSPSGLSKKLFNNMRWEFKCNPKFSNKPALFEEVPELNQGTKIQRLIKPREVSNSICLNLLLRLSIKFLRMSQSPTQRKREPRPLKSRQQINSTLRIRKLNGQKSLAHLLALSSSPPIILLF